MFNCLNAFSAAGHDSQFDPVFDELFIGHIFWTVARWRPCVLHYMGVMWRQAEL